jgi:membrane associated rhomboid family serine protease
MIRPYYNLDDGRERAEYRYSMRPSYGMNSRFTPAVKWLMIACGVVYVLQLAIFNRSPQAYGVFLDWFAFKPEFAFGQGRVWQLVSYMFLHDEILFRHIFFNMLFLWMIGWLVERRLGTRRFLWLYFLAGVTGALAQGALSPDSGCIGASGAIMGVAAACGALYPNMTILFMFIIPMKMKYFVLILAAMDLFAASRSFGNVAHFAHLAGLGAGYLFIRYEPRIGPRLARIYYRLADRLRRRRRGASSTGIGYDDAYQQEVDRLLDKIFREGTTSLSDKENEFLKEASKRFKK